MNRFEAGESGRSRRVPRAKAVGLVFAVALVAAGPAAAGSRAEALAALDRGDVAAARADLTNAAAESLFHLALAESGDARKATLEKARSLAPEGSWLRSAAAGLTAMGEDRAADAAAAYREALARQPDKRVQKLLGDALRAQDDEEGALAAYRAAAALDGDYPAALVAVGDLERQRNDFGAAFNAYNHALDGGNRPFAGLIGRATARLYLGDEEGAFADLSAAANSAATASEKARAQIARFYAEAYLRRTRNGLPAAEQAVAVWEAEGRADFAAGLCNAVGRVLLETGDTAGASDWYDRGLAAIEKSALTPEQRTIWQVRHRHAQARIAAQRREPRRAATLAAETRTLMDADPANAEHYKAIYPYLMGYLRLQERKYPEAIAQLEQAETDQPFIQYLMAEAYARSRDRANARIWYEKALRSGAGLDSESAIVRPLATEWLAKNPAGS